MKKPEFKKPEFKLNISYEFSKREKVMIYILGLALLVVAAIFLVFFPSLNRYEELSAKRDEASFKQQEMQMAIAGLDSKRKSKETATADLVAKKENYAKRMNNEELDNLITTLVVEEGFKAQDLVIISNEISAVPTFGSDESQSNTTMDDATTQTKEMADLAKEQGKTTSTDSSTTTTADTPVSGIYIGTVDMIAEGNIALFENLLDTVSNRTDMQITAIAVASATTQSTTNNSSSSSTIQNLTTGKVGVSVTFNVYMIDKSSTQTN